MADIATNRKALHHYEILDHLEAGLVLTGDEIKAIRARRVSLAGSYARILTNSTPGVENPELYWVGGTISVTSGDAARSRKLLIHRRELTRLIGKLTEKGLTLVPLRLYLMRGRAKLELGLGKGKQLYDKRQTIKKRDADRTTRQAEKSARLG